ncbi:MAG TPA: hypothetical protein VG186_08515 [Solirubrobacteraceae bacterium]|jgi:hypothetical protein|nr:hypothetical protein [Solirubrobacteraceae bacterium]
MRLVLTRPGFHHKVTGPPPGPNFSATSNTADGGAGTMIGNSSVLDGAVRAHEDGGHSGWHP